MNKDTSEVKLTAELTEEEKASGRWVKASQVTAGMNRHQRRVFASRLRKQKKGGANGQPGGIRVGEVGRGGSNPPGGAGVAAESSRDGRGDGRDSLRSEGKESSDGGEQNEGAAVP